MSWLRADSSNPNMGLESTPCSNPVYWCPVHQVWLSEEDVKRKGCLAKTSADMLSTRVCRSLQKKDYDEWFSRLNNAQEVNDDSKGT